MSAFTDTFQATLCEHLSTSLTITFHMKYDWKGSNKVLFKSVVE